MWGDYGYFIDKETEGHGDDSWFAWGHRVIQQSSEGETQSV